MFEYPRILGTPEDGRSIAVETRRGTPIVNFVGPEASYNCKLRFDAICKMYGKEWRERKPSTGVYNCAGMVWASRRASLPEPSSWKTIIQDDGYRMLNSNEAPHVGDVAVYRAKNSGEWIHIARICEIKEISISGGGGSGPKIPMALSKWDLTSGESIHAINDVHLNGGEEFEVSLYTDRP